MQQPAAGVSDALEHFDFERSLHPNSSPTEPNLRLGLQRLSRAVDRRSLLTLLPCHCCHCRRCFSPHQQITVPGPHTARVLQAGRSLTMVLTPLGPSHPALNPVGLTSSVKRCVHSAHSSQAHLAACSYCSSCTTHQHQRQR